MVCAMSNRTLKHQTYHCQLYLFWIFSQHYWRCLLYCSEFLMEMDNSQNITCNNLDLCVLSSLALLEPTPPAYMCAHNKNMMARYTELFCHYLISVSR